MRAWLIAAGVAAVVLSLWRRKLKRAKQRRMALERLRVHTRG